MAVVQPKLWNSISAASSGAADLDAITMLPNGGYVVTFRQDQRIAFQIYDGKGDKVGDTQFVASPLAGKQWEPDILTYNADGSFVITWTEAENGSGGGRILRSQAFDMSGARGAATTVNTATQADGAHLSTNGQGGWATAYVEGLDVNQTITPTIRFVVTDSEGNQGTPISISGASGIGRPDVTWIGGSSYAVSYLTTGVNSGFAFSVVNNGVVASTSISNAVEADVTALKDPQTGVPTGQFVVVYRTDAGAIISKTYQLNGNTIGEVAGRSFELFPATPNLSSADYKTSMTALHDGGYAVAYMAPGSDLNNIWIRVFDKDGNTTAQPFEIKIPLNMQTAPAIHEMADGRLAVSWANPSVGIGQIDTVIVDARAEKVKVTGTATDDIYAPSKHTGDYFDGGDGIDTLTFQGAEAGVSVNLAAETGTAGDAAGDTYKNFENIIGSKFDDTLVGSAVSNTLEGGAGNDVLDGGEGIDRLIGGTGNDTYYVDDAQDAVVETSTGGTDLVYSSVSYTLAAYVEKLYAYGSGTMDLTGNALANTIKGNAAANKINGGAGKDTLYGGAGKDIFVFDTKPSSSNVDKLADYNVAYDSIQLDNKYFTKLGSGSPTSPKKLASSAFWKGAKAHDASDRIIYDSTKGYLYYDADGTGSSKQVLIATMPKGLKMTNAEFYVI